MSARIRQFFLASLAKIALQKTDHMADKQPQRLTALINSGGCIVNTTTIAEISHPWFRDILSDRNRHNLLKKKKIKKKKNKKIVIIIIVTSIS